MNDPSPLPIVFVTVGTDHHRFDRLVRWMDTWAAANLDRATVTIQYGTSVAPRDARGLAYAEHSEMEALIGTADVLVCHAGSGTMSDARRLGRRPLVVPRRPELKEHVDAHQVTIARHLASRGEILLAEDFASLERLLSFGIEDPASLRIAVPPDGGPDEAIRRFAELVDPIVFAPRRRPWWIGRPERWRA